MCLVITLGGVKGEVEYDRLIKEFGVEKITIDNDPLLKKINIISDYSINNYKVLSSYKKPKGKKQNEKLDKIINNLAPYKENAYIRLTKKRDKVEKPEILKILNLIKKNLNVKIIEFKNHRKNNQFSICSKELVKNINEYYNYIQLEKHLVMSKNKIKER